MIKTSVYNLAIGMHVSKLDRVWMSTSFFRRSFLIKNENQLKRLKAECEFVFIDPDKSKNTLLSPIEKTTTTEAIESASIEVSKTKNLLIKFFAQLQQGVNLDTKSLIPSISSLTNDVFNNTETYLYLAKLKEKDNSLSEKSIKVFIFYLAFAKHIGIKKDKLFEIGTAAILHDIGMLSVPEGLLRSAFINKDERKYIQNHTNVGVEILSKENVFSKLTLRTIKHHHENIDGAGYPDGLKGRDISLYARMLNIICMYEAITRDRVYKKGIFPIEAVRTLVCNVNSKIDTRLTFKFIEMLGVYPLGSIVSIKESGELVQIISFDNNKVFRAMPSEAINKKQQFDKLLTIHSCDVHQMINVNSCFVEELICKQDKVHAFLAG